MRERPVVLTVDHDPQFLGTLAVLLERLNFSVLPVTTCSDALDLARLERPRAITMNMQMPDMSCIAFLQELRADEALAATPVILFTGVREKQQVWEAMSLGCIEVLDQPIELARLHQALQRCNIYPDGRRRHLRAPFTKKIMIRVNGEEQEIPAMTLAERGIMLRMVQPLPKGTVVEVRIPLADGQSLQLEGEVLYHSAVPGGVDKAAGVAVKFERVTIKEMETLYNLVKQLLIGDIVTNQPAPVVSPD